jgi:hypothetical protein
MRFIRIIIQWIHSILNRLLVRIVDVNETNDVVRIVTKEIGLAWVEMENHVEIHNKFFIPYYLEEVKLTYYNDAGQNVGYLHFKGPQKIPAFQKRMVKMPAKMSNITALFNAARLLLSDNIKTRTVGTSRIRFFGVSFVLPIDDIMVIDREKIVTEQLDEAEKQRRRDEKAERDKQWQLRKAERKARREERREKLKSRLDAERILRKEAAERRAVKQAARARLERIKNLRRQNATGHSTPKVEPEIKKELQDEPATPIEILSKGPDIRKEGGSSIPGQDKSYSDPSA